MRKSAFVLSLLACFLFCTASSYAKIWQVNSDTGSSPDFFSLQEAHDAASAGDTIYVAGSVTDYGTLTSSKSLIVFGPGYFLNENTGLQLTALSARVSSIQLDPGSEGTEISGLEVGQLSIVASDLTIRRNMIGYVYFNTDTYSEIAIMQNYITISIGSLSSHTCSNIIVQNNYINFVSLSETCTLIVQNNVLAQGLAISNSVITNNILISGSFGGSNNTFSYNMADATQFGTNNGNQANVDMSTVFVGWGNSDYSTDAQWQLKSGSPAIGAGATGEDLGMFGGILPYVLSGVPGIPTIYEFTAPGAVTTESGLPVQLRIRTNN